MALPIPDPALNQLAEHTSLVSRIRAISRRERNLIASKQYNASIDPEIKIRSWKMNEDGYYDVPTLYPTLACGLFTRWLPAHEGQPEGKEGGHWRIVARGHDKIFDVGETDWTSWGSLAAHTEGPYNVTARSNGCKIFIAALTPNKLLITSKHSLGPSKHVPVSHAQMAKCWLDKHLNSVGKTQAELAARLWEDNWTMVCELCDDSFEERILPVAADKTGLQLHGINASQPAFHPQPPEFLQAFARQWGLIATAYLTLSSIADVQNFTQECAKTGSWDGERIEGFVVRTHVKRVPSRDELAGNVESDAPPYPPGHSLFFKVEFDEPYTMYNDFREITRALLRGSGNGDTPSVPSSMLHRLETRVYKLWIESEIRRDRKQFDGFMQGHGIIATRDRFFAWINGADAMVVPVERQPQKGTVRAVPSKAKAALSSKAKAAVASKVKAAVPKSVAVTARAAVEDTVVNSAPRPRPKWIVYPVGIPGCGKTSIAVALSHLFGFAHTQSDDVKGRNSAPAFLASVAKLLDKNDVVIADKNNHLIQHRAGLRQAVSNVRQPVKMLALKWATTGLPRNTIHRICADRVAARGNNHQSLIPGDYGTHEEVLWRFLREADALKKDEFDACIEMYVQEGFKESLARAVDGIVGALGLSVPSQDQIGEALARVGAHKAATKVAAAPAKEYPRYYGLLPEADFVAIAGRRILAVDAPEEVKQLWRSATSRSDGKSALLTFRPHVTLAHEKMVGPEDLALWDRCAALAPNAMFRLHFNTLVYNGRVLAAVVDDIRPSDGDESASAFIEKLTQSARKRLHVTVARRDVKVMPVEAKELVEEWRRNPGAVQALALSEPVDVLARVRGFSQ